MLVKWLSRRFSTTSLVTAPRDSHIAKHGDLNVFVFGVVVLACLDVLQGLRLVFELAVGVRGDVLVRDQWCDHVRIVRLVRLQPLILQIHDRLGGVSTRLLRLHTYPTGKC